MFARISEHSQPRLGLADHHKLTIQPVFFVLVGLAMKLTTFAFLATLCVSCVSAKRLDEGRARGEESTVVRVLKG